MPVYTYDTDLVRVGRNELGTNVGDWKGAMDHDGAIYFRFTPILTRNQPAHYGVIATIYFSDNSGAWSLPQMQIGTVPGSSGGLYFWLNRVDKVRATGAMQPDLNTAGTEFEGYVTGRP